MGNSQDSQQQSRKPACIESCQAQSEQRQQYCLAALGAFLRYRRRGVRPDNPPAALIRYSLWQRCWTRGLQTDRPVRSWKFPCSAPRGVSNWCSCVRTCRALTFIDSCPAPRPEDKITASQIWHSFSRALLSLSFQRATCSNIRPIARAIHTHTHTHTQTNEHMQTQTDRGINSGTHLHAQVYSANPPTRTLTHPHGPAMT